MVRWHNIEYDRLRQQTAIELDPVKRATLSIVMNDLRVENLVLTPLIWRNDAMAVSQTLRGLGLSTWGSNLWELVHWYRQACPVRTC
jgi:ABC-type transport system substrate-binding protein